VITGAANPAAGAAVLIFLIVAGLALYFIPTLVAVIRHHTQWGAIFALNLFLGWTFLGWVGALIWACSSFKYMPSHPAQHQPPPYQWPPQQYQRYQPCQQPQYPPPPEYRQPQQDPYDPYNQGGPR
jgi:hypothetical protein